MTDNMLYAEQAVIGSLLIDNSTFDEIADNLQPDDFASHLHRDIFKAIRSLLENNNSADIISTSQYLSSKENNSSYNEIFTKLCSIANSTFISKNIKYYAEIVKKNSLDRKLIYVGQEIIKSVHDQRENRLDHALQMITEITDETTSSILSVADILPSVISSIDQRQAIQSDITGLPTGFNKLDSITHGLHGGNLIILAARPSMGKTLLGMNIVEHIAIHKKKSVAVFSLEMSKEELIERSLAGIANIESDQLRSGKLSKSDCQKIFSTSSVFQNVNLFIDDKSSLSVSDIRAKCRRIKREYGLDLVLVDYITLMESEGENETIKIGNISRGLKLLARDLNVPVIAISQLNREVERRNNKRPCMADLRQSGAIEQDADLILLIYRDEVYNKNTSDKGIAEIIIAKHRNGSLGTVNLLFNNQYCRFDNFTGMPAKKATQITAPRGQTYEY